MAFSLYRTDLRYREYELTARNRQGEPTALSTTVRAALVPMGETPDADTVWLPVNINDTVVLVLLVGPDAPPSAGALVVPEEGADLYFQYVDDPESEADFVESFTVR